jgi:hypothetical protein
MKATIQEIVEGIHSSVTNFFPFPPGQHKYRIVENTSSFLMEVLRTATHMYVLRGGIIPTLPTLLGPDSRGQVVGHWWRPNEAVYIQFTDKMSK